MKISDVKIILDKEYFHCGEKLTGSVIVKANHLEWYQNGIVFIKFYDKLEIEWSEEDETVPVEAIEIFYTNISKPFQVDMDTFITGHKALLNDNSLTNEFEIAYQFEFVLPHCLQGTVSIEDKVNAKCNYFLKAYLSDDPSVAHHYKEGTNVFSEFFKKLNHTFCKQEVIVRSGFEKLSTALNEKQTFESNTKSMKALVTLPKLVFTNDESIDLSIEIMYNQGPEEKGKFDIETFAVQLLQIIQVRSNNPSENTKEVQNVLAYSTRNKLHEHNDTKLMTDEFIQIPNDIIFSTDRSITSNPISVRYRVVFEMSNESDLTIDIPIFIKPLDESIKY